MERALLCRSSFKTNKNASWKDFEFFERNDLQKKKLFLSVRKLLFSYMMENQLITLIFFATTSMPRKLLLWGLKASMCEYYLLPVMLANTTV